MTADRYLTSAFVTILLLASASSSMKPLRVMDNDDLLHWYLADPTNTKQTTEHFGKNRVTLQRIPAINALQKKLYLWNDHHNKLDTITVNLQHYIDQATGWQTMQALDCPRPIANIPHQAEACLRGHQLGDRTIRMLLASKLEDPMIEDKVMHTAACMRHQASFNDIELNCYFEAFVSVNIARIKKQMVEEFKAKLMNGVVDVRV